MNELYDIGNTYNFACEKLMANGFGSGMTNIGDERISLC